MLCLCGIRQAEKRMAKSGKEQMPRSQCVLGPSLQGSGGDFNVLAVWKTFLVPLSSALKHWAPARVETGSEKGWGRVNPPCVWGNQGLEKVFGKVSARPWPQWSHLGNGTEAVMGLKHHLLRGGRHVLHPRPGKGSLSDQVGKVSQKDPPTVDARCTQRGPWTRMRSQEREDVCSRNRGQSPCAGRGRRWGSGRGWKRWPTHS